MNVLSDAGLLPSPQLPLYMSICTGSCRLDRFLHIVDARLVLWVILHESPGAFNLMAPVCSSWGVPNRGTSRRDFLNWAGAQHLPYIKDANCMISRSLA